MSALDGLSPYDLGRARGAATGRAEPTELDEEWCHEASDVLLEEDDDMDRFADGMSDGRGEDLLRQRGLTVKDPIAPEAIAAARDELTRAYGLGRTCGAVKERSEPTDDDYAWMTIRLGEPLPPHAKEDFARGMLNHGPKPCHRCAARAFIDRKQRAAKETT